MNQFTLQPYKSPSSRYRCPQCNHRDKCFVRYINTETGEQLADHVGRCGREDKCGYHYKPRDYFRDAGQSIVHKPWSMAKNKKQSAKNNGHGYGPSTMAYGLVQPSYIHPDIANASFKHYERNNFVQYLIEKLGYQTANQLVGRYRIGTSKHWPGATVFWQLDAQGKVRTGKVMLYDAQTGKRVKKPFNHITWAHVLVGSGQLAGGSGELAVGGLQFEASTVNCPPPTANFSLQQCLFGEHLLTENPTLPIAILESEKTAIIASAYAPGSIWLAAGSASNLNAQICQALQNRTVTLYPDLGAYQKWTAKAKELQAAVKGSTFNVSDVLERIANDEQRKEGLDLADCL